MQKNLRLNKKVIKNIKKPSYTHSIKAPTTPRQKVNKKQEPLFTYMHVLVYIRKYPHLEHGNSFRKHFKLMFLPLFFGLVKFIGGYNI